MTILAFAQAGLVWHILKGIGTQSESALENQAADVEYGLIAAHCQDYITNDDESRKRYEDLLELSRLIWQS